LGLSVWVGSLGAAVVERFDCPFSVAAAGAGPAATAGIGVVEASTDIVFMRCGVCCC
jgi:hypothetical protein